MISGRSHPPHLVAVVGPLPARPQAPPVVRASNYAQLLKVFGLSDPVSDPWRPVFFTAWRALAEGVPRVLITADAEALEGVDEPLVVAGAAAPLPGDRVCLYDPPAPGAEPGDRPEGMVGLWPWVRAVAPGGPGPVTLPPSALVAGLFATGKAASSYAADPVPGPPPPADWVRLVPAGRRRTLHLDPPPSRPGAPHPLEGEPTGPLELLWAEARTAPNPVATFTRAVHARYGPGARVVVEDDALRVLLPAPPRSGRGLVVRLGRR